MAFNDNPEVDIYSKNSEESVLAVKLYLMQKHGFIVRDETPDKGVDFDVELILDNKASGFKFAIQLKSVEQAKLVVKDSIQYVAYRIKTSRLGYLCRRSPGFGLLIIYDDNSKISYFDYVENIVDNIDAITNDNTWRENETVTTYINTDKIVDATSMSELHRIMQNRCDSHQNMYTKYASDFGLPDFHKHVADDLDGLIEKYGYALLNSKDYHILYGYLAKLPLKSIVDNSKLVLLAAITYNQIGQNVEGEYFISKSKKFINEYSDTEKELLLIFQVVAEFQLGKIDKSVYLQKLKSIEPEIRSDANGILVKIQILFTDMTNINVFATEPFKEILPKLDSLIMNINICKIDEEIKNYYTLEILSIMFQVGIQHFFRSTTDALIQKKVLGEAPLKARLDNAHMLIMLLGIPMKSLKEIYDYSLKANNDHLKAAVIFKRTFMFNSFVMANMSSIFSGEVTFDKYREQQQPQLFEQSYHDSLEAYNIFNKKHDLSIAYKSLSMSLEVNYIYSFLYGKNIDDQALQATRKRMEQLESALSLEPNEIIAENMIISFMARNNTDLVRYASLPEESEHLVAELFIKAIGLPIERVPNLISEMVFMKKAEAAINMKYFEILQNLSHTKSKETFYSTPPQHIIKCKGCNYETIESDNLDELLSCLRTEHSHVCL